MISVEGRRKETENGVYLVVSLGEELDGWESLDLDTRNLVFSEVHLGNQDILRVLEVFT